MEFFNKILRAARQKYYEWNLRRVVAARGFARKSVAEIFTETYQKRYWRSRESVSGAGSELRQTEVLRRELPHFLKKHAIKSLLDLPCGDFNWMQKTDLSVVRYMGADIVADLIAENKRRFSQPPQRTFLQLDLLSDPLPTTDCVLVRDCLVHFSYQHLAQAIDNLKKNGSTYLLTTHFPKWQKNKDIQTGFWRPLNLQAAPFLFPPPLDFLEEKCTEAGSAFSDKSLALWRLQSLPSGAEILARVDAV